MSKKIVYTTPEGTVHVIHPVGNAKMKDVESNIPKDAVNVRKVTADMLPKSRLYRNAWDDSNPEDFVAVNGAKAKQVAHERRRLHRFLELDPLDKEIALNIPGTDIGKIEQQRQKIRDKYAVIQDDIDLSIPDDVIADTSVLEEVERTAGTLKYFDKN